MIKELEEAMANKPSNPLPEVLMLVEDIADIAGVTGHCGEQLGHLGKVYYSEGYNPEAYLSFFRDGTRTIQGDPLHFERKLFSHTVRSLFEYSLELPDDHSMSDLELAKSFGLMVHQAAGNNTPTELGARLLHITDWYDQYLQHHGYGFDLKPVMNEVEKIRKTIG